MRRNITNLLCKMDMTHIFCKADILDIFLLIVETRKLYSLWSVWFHIIPDNIAGKNGKEKKKSTNLKGRHKTNFFTENLESFTDKLF